MFAAGTAHVAVDQLKTFVGAVRKWFISWLRDACELSSCQGAVHVKGTDITLLSMPGRDDRHFVAVYFHKGVLVDACSRDRFARKLRYAPQLRGMHWWPHRGPSKSGGVQMVHGVQSTHYNLWLPSSECFAKEDTDTCRWEPIERQPRRYQLYGKWPEGLEQRIARALVTNVPTDDAARISVRDTYVRTLGKRQKCW